MYDFWQATAAVFRMPERSRTCGTHIHITPGPQSEWSLQQIQRIAIGIVRYEDLVQKMLPSIRRTERSTSNPGSSIMPTYTDGTEMAQHFCESNTSSSKNLSKSLNRLIRPHDQPEPRYFKTGVTYRLFAEPISGRAAGMAELEVKIMKMTTVDELVVYMQHSRYVLWNFANLKGGKKTIEFRGGRSIRGLHRTRWWIAFVVGFIHHLLTDVGSH
jgi:hypothetical protein